MENPRNHMFRDLKNVHGPVNAGRGRLLLQPGLAHLPLHILHPPRPLDTRPPNLAGNTYQERNPHKIKKYFDSLSN